MVSGSSPYPSYNKPKRTPSFRLIAKRVSDNANVGLLTNQKMYGWGFSLICILIPSIQGKVDGSTMDTFGRRYSVGGSLLPSYHAVMADTNDLHHFEEGLPDDDEGKGCCTIL